MQVLDSISPLARIKLSAELADKVKLLSGDVAALQRVSATARVAAILRELGAGEKSPQEAPQGADTDFPIKEAASSYSGISHSGNARAKGDAEDYEKTISQAVEEAKPLAETDAQRAAMASEEAAFRAEYLRNYRVLMGVRAGTYSGHIAGRSSLNSRQANARNSALDKAMDRFYGWLKTQDGRIKRAVVDARSPEQKAAAQAEVDAAQAAKDAKAAEAAQKSVEFMLKLITFKSGDKLPVGGAVVTKVNKNREGVPSSLTVTLADGTKPFDDKIDVLRVLYRGDKARLASDFEAAKAILWLAKEAPSEPTLSTVSIPSDELKAHVLSAAYNGKGIDPVSDGQYLAAIQKKTGRGIFVVKGNFDRAAFKSVMSEAVAAGVDTGKLYVFGELGIYSGAGIEFMRLDSLPPIEADEQPAEAKEIDQLSGDGGDPLPIIEHATKGGKGKIIRGIIRTDLSYAEAKAIDEYTFKKDGGWFIREKHLAGYKPDGAAPAPAVVKPELTPEQQAQEAADRLADEQLKEQQKRQVIADKLREAGQATIEKAEEELGRDRQTNTARRADMASSIIARHEQSRAIGKTMQNLAEAIASGEAQHLAGITSRAAVETLHERLVQGMYEYDKTQNLTYSEQQRQNGRPATEADAKYATMPMPMWGSAGTSLAKVLEAIKGKKGSVELAKKIRFTPGPDAEILRALKAMIGAKDFDYVVGWWNIQAVAKAERLRRAGITTNEQLRAALGEYLQYREGARAEDPIKKAERAIIGQKVGIDFFPTPVATASRMADLARISKGDRVLEPSAGNGNLADAAKAKGAEVDVLEISSQLRDILTAKGYNVVGYDFEAFTPEEKYDAVIMNPPFGSGTNRLDSLHIQRAFDMLKPGGRLVAIAGEGVFIGRDAKAVQFRDWLDSHGADVEQLEQNTFKDKNLLATTGANGRLIVLTK